jgi:hypothetical protein
MLLYFELINNFDTSKSAWTSRERSPDLKPDASYRQARKTQIA